MPFENYPMRSRRSDSSARLVLFALLVFLSSPGLAANPSRAAFDDARSRMAAALRSMDAADTPAHEALALVWDGNAYIQCHRNLTHEVHCEAAGALMQSSLESVLTPERVDRLNALGWRLDSNFGNYVQDFSEDTKTQEISEVLLTSLREGYGANPADFQFQNSAVSRVACPPRDGPSQNLAGAINDAKEMAPFAVYACAYTPPPPTLIPLESLPRARNTTAEVIAHYQSNIMLEIERLRAASGHTWVFTVLQTDSGYVQCESTKSIRAIDCEALSAESEPNLVGALTPARVSPLRALGYAPPGLKQNYYREYEAFESDAAIANALLTILHDVYGYEGKTKLEVTTEKGERDLLK
jgi:hypothetical protein